MTDYGEKYYAPDGQVAAVGDKFSNLVDYFAEDYRPSIENDNELIDVSSIDIQEKYTVRGDTLGTAAQIAHQEGDAGDILISENNTYYWCCWFFWISYDRRSFSVYRLEYHSSM